MVAAVGFPEHDVNALRGSLLVPGRWDCYRRSDRHCSLVVASAAKCAARQARGNRRKLKTHSLRVSREPVIG